MDVDFTGVRRLSVTENRYEVAYATAMLDLSEVRSQGDLIQVSQVYGLRDGSVVVAVFYATEYDKYLKRFNKVDSVDLQREFTEYNYYPTEVLDLSLYSREKFFGGDDVPQLSNEIYPFVLTSGESVKLIDCLVGNVPIEDLCIDDALSFYMEVADFFHDHLHSLPNQPDLSKFSLYSVHETRNGNIKIFYDLGLTDDDGNVNLFTEVILKRDFEFVKNHDFKGYQSKVRSESYDDYITRVREKERDV